MKSQRIKSSGVAELKAFKLVKDELTVTDDGFILMGTKLVIPSKLRNRIVNLAHEARVNLSAYFQKIFGAEKELIWFLAHILAQKGAIKQWEFNVPLYQTIDINYSLAHTGAQSCCAPKCLAQSSKEIHPGHEGHQGIFKTKSLLREKVWFPGIDQMVENTVRTVFLAKLLQQRKSWNRTKCPSYPVDLGTKFQLTLVDRIRMVNICSLLLTNILVFRRSKLFVQPLESRSYRNFIEFFPRLEFLVL